MYWRIVSLCEVAYLVAMIVVIILEKRSPISTIAWILAIAMLPYVGLVVYFFFGPHRVKRKRMRHGRSSEQVRGQLAAYVERHSTDVTAPHRTQLARLAV